MNLIANLGDIIYMYVYIYVYCIVNMCGGGVIAPRASHDEQDNMILS
jgi:hypothetical protein